MSAIFNVEKFLVIAVYEIMFHVLYWKFFMTQAFFTTFDCFKKDFTCVYDCFLVFRKAEEICCGVMKFEAKKC